jgi:hypothetical protein
MVMPLPILAVMVLAAAGSGVAAFRRVQPPPLRLAHAVMASVMLAMVVPGGQVMLIAGLVALAAAVPVVIGHYVVHGSGLPCAIDLGGMALLLTASIAPHPQPRLILLLAVFWVVSSLWAHGETALRTRLNAPIVLEAATAMTGAAAMTVMAVMMA